MLNSIEKFDKTKILCIGDLMLDNFVYGSVDRVSPEAPVPVFLWKTEKTVLGGVGNVVANLNSLGVKTSLICRMGKDEAGNKVQHLLDKAGTTVYPILSNDCPTIVKTRFISKNNHVLRMDQEKITPLTDQEEQWVINKFSAVLSDVNMVIISDYAKGFLSDNLLQKIITLCNQNKIPVLVDPKGSNYKKYCGATLIKPNLKELQVASGEKIDTENPDFINDIVKAAKKLLHSIGINQTIVTLSEKGMIYVPSDDNIGTIYLPTEAREVSDVSGAGDTTIAVLAAALATDTPMDKAMELSNIAAGIVVSKVGTAVTTQSEIIDAINRKENGCFSFKEKLYTLTQLKKKIQKWHDEGYKIGFTNGCFDCLHYGHLSSLYQAKDYCDKLIVAVNTDNSVRRIKGPARPIQDENTRSFVLASLEIVDAVILFDDDTALPTVQELRPDIIAKEGYSMDIWPEAQFVNSYGGKAITLERMDGYSTTSIIQAMEQKNGK